MSKSFYLIVLVCALAFVGLAMWVFQSPQAGPAASVQSGTPPLLIEPWQADSNRGRLKLLSQPGGSGFENLPPGVVTPILRNRERPSTPRQELRLDLGRHQPLTLEVVHHSRHDNGDISIHANNPGNDLERATLTFGEAGMFGRINSEEGLFLVHSDATGTWLLDLSDERLDVDDFHNDTIGQPLLHPIAAMDSGQSNQSEHTGSMLHELGAVTSAGENLQTPSQIDVMFIYPPDMTARYPGDLIDTRLNHLVAIANQAMVDSQVPIAVRLVHHRMVNYDQHQDNREALVDLVRALRGESVPGLAGLQQSRQFYGADIVALTWPHDIETRGSCGIAFFPRQAPGGGFDSSLGVHIDNDGVSNWSVCSDAVFTHELGHNLNAEHQRGAASADDPNRANFAFIRDQRFHTLMGSFGTGHRDRFRRLDVFSNPHIQCGGIPCGSTITGQGANNAAEITALAPVVAGYLNQTQPGQVSRPPPSEPDSDGDGVSDWLDPYPFDSHDGQAPPGGATSVFDPRQLRDPQQDSDWELLVASSGSDQILSFDLEGRFRGVIAAPEAIDPGPILTEFTDMAIDDQGRLYLLASGDVRRYDRLSGQLIDVYLDAGLPTPRQLQSSFPRAMGFIPGNQLVVLGDNAIERYNAERVRLNFPTTNQQQTNPVSWNDLLDLPLRGFDFHQSRLFVTEGRFNRIMAFSTITGNRLTDIAGPNNPHLSDPWDIAFDDNGSLYVANGAAGNVLRFNIASASFTDEFVPAGSGGLEFARALAFGPDGHLYVACQQTSQVLRFNGQTGAPMGAVAESGQAGLSGPSSLLFVPRVDQVHRGHSGSYFDPDRDGEGWLIEILNDDYAAMSWFTYPPLDGSASDHNFGEQAWMVGVGAISGNRIFFDDILLTRGQGFGSSFDPASLELLPWGSAEFEFVNCSSGTVDYQGPPAFGSGHREVQRLVGIPGLPCGSPASAPQPDAPGVSGQWSDPNLDGQGWFLQEVEPGRIFAAWFTYDDNANQIWLVGTGSVNGNVLQFDQMLTTGGTWFGEDFEAADVERRHWGSMTFTFNDCNSAVVDYASDAPGFGNGTMFPQRITRLSDLECQLP
ncbi:MAG: zinc-dependent metalloprotease family protein [Wenzhouxiangella sp.]